MANNITTRFVENGTDIGNCFITKEYMLEAYPNLVPWMKAPALWAWGNNCCTFLNNSSFLGNDNRISQSSPVQTISGGTDWKIIGGLAAIKTDGTLWEWGNLLGDNTSINKSSPVQTISGGTNWKTVSTSVCHKAAIKTDGTLWLWGNNILGNNNLQSRSSPVQTVSGGTNWKSVSVSATHTAAIKTDGTLWLWGSSSFGRLGDNSYINKSSPVQTISGGTNWKAVALGHCVTTALKTDGTLWTWGTQVSGALGNNINTTSGKSSPVQTISGGTNWRSISNGAAIKTDGTLWIWGSNSGGILGNNSTVNHSSPVQTISGGSNWLCVIRDSSVMAIKTDGTLWTWGFNNAGELGTGDIVNRSSPVQTISAGTGWKSIASAARSCASFAICDEGEY